MAGNGKQRRRPDGAVVTDSVSVGIQFRGFVRKDEKNRWISGCPVLGVYSQGTTKEKAISCLIEAVELWIESCVERGTLHQALLDAGFHHSRINPEEATQLFDLGEDEAILGESFPIDINIPAYQVGLQALAST